MSNNILLVEDDTTLAMIISETLAREGFDVTTAGNGEDGLKKPFKMLELIVRIKALMRRNRQREEQTFTLGSYTFDMAAQSLETNGGSPIELTLIEAKILRELILNVGRTVEASTLMMLVWQRDDPYSRNSLHGFIHKLRHYLHHDPSIAIINQRGHGYMLVVKQ